MHFPMLFQPRLFAPALVLYFLLFALLPGSSPGAQGPQKRVLLLHSYHQGLPWTDEVTEGIETALSTSGGNIRLQVEYLDAERNPDTESLFAIYEQLLRLKLARHPIDLVLLSDNDALHFALGHRKDLFAGIPLVFSGVDGFSSSMIEGIDRITGVAERPSFAETMEIALKLHPGTELMVVAGGRVDADRRGIFEASEGFSHRTSFEFWDDLAIDELEGRLALLPDDSLVLLAGAVKDGEGGYLPLAETGRRTREVSPVPIYAFRNSFLGSGILGGKFVSGFNQGRLAAEYALRILGGEAPEEMAILGEEANTFIFDYRELSRSDISPGALPDGRLINAPPSYYRVSEEHFRLGAGAFALLAVSTLFLLYFILSRRGPQDALRQSEERLRLALEGAREAIWDWHVPTGKNLINDQWASMLGYRREEIEERISQWESLIHPDDRAAVRRAQSECMRGKIPNFAAEFRMRTKSGAWKWILGRGMVVERGADGEPIRLAGTHSDISRVKKAERALQESLADAEKAKEKIDAILKSMADGLIATNIRNRIVLMNQAAQDLLGLPLDEALGRPIADVLQGIPVGEQPWTGGAEGQPIDMELYDFQKEQMRTIQVRSSVSRSEKGRKTGFITILQDLTRIREMDRMKSEFISTAAHELNTPLTAIMGFAELLCSDRVFESADHKEYLGIILDKAQVLGERVDDLLDLSRIESGGLIALDPVPCEMKSILEQTLSHYRRSSPRHSFDLFLPGEEAQLVADRGKLGQVLENLLGNAVKYSPKGGLVRVEGMLAGDFFRITVEDEGIGMTEEQLGKMFDKFYRVDSSNTAVGGLGLGMAIARNIVQAHGGSIWAESEEGRGTKVSFTLPVTEVDSVEARG